MSTNQKDVNQSIVEAITKNIELINDKLWRMENLYWIVTKDGVKDLFKLNRAQRHFAENYLLREDPYHRHIILKSRQLGFCLDPNTRILTSDLRWVAIKDLQIGQEIIGVDEEPVNGRGKGRKMKPAIVQHKQVVFRDAYKIKFDDGREVICTGHHPWLSKSDTIPQPFWRTISQTKKDRDLLHTSKLKVGDYVRWITKPWGEPDYEDGWFSGMLDGEGSIAKKNVSAGINVSQREGDVFDRLLNYVKREGYSYRIEDDNTKRKTKYGKTPVPKICIGRMDEMFKMIGKLRPSRFIKNRFWENRELPGKKTSIGWAKIVSIEKLPDQEMIDMQTSTGTFIAEGFVSHNTTFIDLWLLDEILFNTNREALIVAHKVEDAKEIFDRKIDFALRNMSEDIKSAFFKLERNSAKKIQVIIDYGENKGSMSAIQVSSSGRSGTFKYVHVSEFAKMCVQYPKNAHEVETGTFPAVPFDGFIFIESTAEGMAGRFYEMFQENWAKRDSITPMLSRVKFVPHFYNWQYDDMELKKITEIIPVEEMEEGEIDWKSYKEEHKLSDKEITYYYMKWLQLGRSVSKLKQEFPTTAEEAFLSTGQTYFPTSKAVQLFNVAESGKHGELVRDSNGKIQFKELSTGKIEVFKLPEKGKRYVIGGDTAEGLAHGDFSVLYVVEAESEDCVALYHSRVPPDEYADDAYELGTFYNNALLAIEINKDGYWVNDALEKRGYLNLYYRRVLDDITQKITKLFGWKTMSSTRPFALAALRTIFIKKNGGFPKKLLGEMLTFVRNEKGKPEAMDGKYDDVIIAGAIAYAVLQDHRHLLIEQKNGESKKSLMSIMFGETSI